MTQATNSAFRPEVRKKLPALIGFRFVLNSGTRMVYAFLSPLARGIGVSRETMSLLIAGRDAVSLISPAIGRRLDEVGYARILKFGALMATGGLLASGFGIVGVIVGFLMFGLGRAAVHVAVNTWIADSVAYERRGRATGFIEMVWGASALIALPIMGLLIGQVGWWASFGALGVLAAPFAFALVRQHEDAPPARTGSARTKLTLSQNSRWLLLSYASMTLASQFLFIRQGLWLEDDYGFDPEQIGFAVLTFGAVEICATFALAHISDALGKRNSMLGGVAVMSAGMLALAVTGTPPIAVGLALVVVTSFGFEFGVVSALPLLSEAEPSARGAMIGRSVAIATAIRSVGSFAAATLYAATAFTGLMVAGAGLGLVSIVVGLLGVREPDATQV